MPTKPNPALDPEEGHDWHREHVKAQLRMRGTTLFGLAEQSGYDSSSFYRALVRPWPAVERIIAKALGHKPQDIWPSRYDGKGVPLCRRRTKRIRRSGESHRQIGGVA